MIYAPGWAEAYPGALAHQAMRNCESQGLPPDAGYAVHWHWKNVLAGSFFRENVFHTNAEWLKPTIITVSIICNNLL